MDMATQILERMPIACDVFMVSGGILKSMNIVKFAEMREGDVNAAIWGATQLYKVAKKKL